MNGSIYKTAGSRDALSGFEDSILAMMPYPYETRTVETCAGDTHVVTAGEKEKPALVLLHGAASNLLSFGGDIPRYMGDHFVVAVDIVGEAGKSAPLRPSWHDDAYVRWLSDVLDGLQIKTADVVRAVSGGLDCGEIRRAAAAKGGKAHPALARRNRTRAFLLHLQEHCVFAPKGKGAGEDEAPGVRHRRNSGPGQRFL